MTTPTPFDIPDTQLQRYFELAVDLFCIGDTNGLYRRVNAATERILGFTEAELQSMNFLELVHPDDRRGAVREFARQARGAPTRSLEVRYRCKDGTYRRIAWSAWPHLEAGLIYAVGRDVTEAYRRREEQRLAQQISDQLWSMRTESDLSPILAAIRAALVALEIPFAACGINHVDTTHDPPIVRAHSMETDGDWQQADAEGVRMILRSWLEERIFYRSDLQRLDEYDETALLTRFFSYPVRSVVDVPFSHGTLAVNSREPNAFREEDLSALRRFADLLSQAFRRFEDLRRLHSRNQELEAEVARREMAEAEARQAREIAEAASRSKSAFLANTSHEIRTPLNAILGMAQVLQDDELTPEQEDHVHTLAQASEGLIRVVDDILDLSKIEAGQLELESLTFDPAELLRQVARTIEPRIADRGLELSLDLADDLPPQLEGDAGRLRQILLNLLSNAAKFTEQGVVTLRAAIDGDGANELHIEVIDTGIGIPVERQTAIFEPFAQADTSTTRLYGGTGLGLSICRRLVEMMGGQIGVTSSPGEGSAFRLCIPFVPNRTAKTRDRSPEPELDTAAVESLSVLLVEDNPLNRRVARALLAGDDHRIVEAENGQLGLEAYEQGQFDLVLMDVQMPVMDGFTATAAIRALEQARSLPRVPIVALTAHAMQGDRERCLAAGMDDFVSKPVRREALRQTMGRVLHPAPAASNEADLSPTAPVADEPILDPGPLEELRTLEQVGDDFTVGSFIALFNQSAPQTMLQAQQANEDDDMSALRRHVHSLKGAAREVGALRLARYASALEEALQAEVGDSVVADLEQLQDLLEQSIEALRAYRLRQVGS